jgi:hypothetical protein
VLVLVRCLTYIGSTCLCWRALLAAPLGVASDSSPIVALLIQMIHGNCYNAFKVSTEEGHEPEMILTTPALNAQFDRAGQRLLYEDDKSYENLWRKHNTSSLAHDIWFFDRCTGNHTKLTRDAGEHRDPIWAPDENSFFYLGEQSGSFNVWKLPVVAAGKAAAEQITHFEKNPIRFLSIDQAGDLCFGYDGENYLLPRGAKDPSKVDIQIAAAANDFKPVADSGSYAWWETLQDPALFFGIPEVGLQDDQGQFLERTQVDPDIEVMNDPKSTAEGRDLQLERATTELIKEN